MKTLYFGNQQCSAERIVKTGNSIIGYNGEQEAFALRGVSESAEITLKDESGNPASYDQSKTRLEIMQETIDLLVISSLGGG